MDDIKTNAEYEYPSSLYCVRCDDDVTPQIEHRLESIMNDVNDVVCFRWPIAVCPKCGNELCRRGYNFAMAKAVIEHRMKKEANQT